MNQESIAKTGRRVRFALWSILLIVPVCLLGAPSVLNLEVSPMNDSSVWLTSGWFLLDWFTQVGGSVFAGMNGADNELGVQNVSLVHQLSVVSIFIACSVLILALVWQVDRLFLHYSKGKVFSVESASRFKFIGWLLLTLFAVNAIGSVCLEAVVHQLFQPEALFEQSVAVSQFVMLDLSLLLSGLFMILVAKVMVHGVELQDDADATI